MANVGDLQSVRYVIPVNHETDNKIIDLEPAPSVKTEEDVEVLSPV